MSDNNKWFILYNTWIFLILVIVESYVIKLRKIYMSNIKYKGEKKYVKLELYEWYLIIGGLYNHRLKK